MTLRRASPADTGALRSLMATSNGYDRPEARAMIVAFAGTWSVPDGPNEVWLSEEAGAFVGFFALIPHGSDQELDLFFTANDTQGNGVGRRLFEAMAARARALGASSVVISSNPEAAGFYRRMGAVDVGATPPGDGIGWERPKLKLTL